MDFWPPITHVRVSVRGARRRAFCCPTPTWHRWEQLPGADRGPRPEPRPSEEAGPPLPTEQMGPGAGTLLTVLTPSLHPHPACPSQERGHRHTAPSQHIHRVFSPHTEASPLPGEQTGPQPRPGLKDTELALMPAPGLCPPRCSAASTGVFFSLGDIQDLGAQPEPPCPAGDSHSPPRTQWEREALFLLCHLPQGAKRTRFPICEMTGWTRQPLRPPHLCPENAEAPGGKVPREC